MKLIETKATAPNLVLRLLLLAAAGDASLMMAQSPGTFAPAGVMTAARSQHAATLLLDGRVLLTGGYGTSGEGMVSAEIYDTSTGAFTATGSMAARRRLQSSTLLPDGRVLIVGGYSGGASLASAELYDPGSSSFSSTGSLIWPRGAHTAVLLASGKILILGGYAPAEVYDPATATFTATGSYRGSGECDFCAPSTLLADGRVLFPEQNPAQLYDPATGTFSLTGGIFRIFQGYTAAALLMNGKVLFAGGEGLGRYSSAEVFDPATGTFASTGSMAWSRVWHSLSLLPDGTVLTAGGETDRCTGNPCIFTLSVASAEIYDPLTGAFVATGDMAAPRETHTATLLNDGRVLIAGGVAYGGIDIFFGSLASAELYNPPVLVPAPVLFSLSGDGKGQGAILHAGTSRLASPGDPAVAGEALEIYCNGLSDGSLIPPQIAIGGRMAEILFFGKAPGFPGLNQVNVRVPGGVAPGLTVSVRLDYLERTSNEVKIAVQ